MENLVAILETIGSVKQLQISMTSELSAEPKMTREKKMKIFKVGLEIVKDQFPMDAELILIDRKSGCALKKEKIRELTDLRKMEIRQTELRYPRHTHSLFSRFFLCSPLSLKF